MVLIDVTNINPGRGEIFDRVTCFRVDDTAGAAFSRHLKDFLERDKIPHGILGNRFFAAGNDRGFSRAAREAVNAWKVNGVMSRLTIRWSDAQAEPVCLSFGDVLGAGDRTIRSEPA